MAEAAKALFTAVENGDASISTTEVVLHEVAYVLVSQGHYGLPMAEVVAALATILRLPGFRLLRGEKRRYLEALDLWAAYSSLGFADAPRGAAALDEGDHAGSPVQNRNRCRGFGVGVVALPAKHHAGRCNSPHRGAFVTGSRLR